MRQETIDKIKEVDRLVASGSTKSAAFKQTKLGPASYFEFYRDKDKPKSKVKAKKPIIEFPLSLATDQKTFSIEEVRAIVRYVSCH
jgi:hypothetical protein